MDTKAYDYYLHLREGFMVPMQDTLTMDSLNNSAELQNMPVDFHINPSCNTTDCSAEGRYLNDNGWIVDTEGS